LSWKSTKTTARVKAPPSCGASVFAVFLPRFQEIGLGGLFFVFYLGGKTVYYG
jgi:hypothetical protein